MNDKKLQEALAAQDLLKNSLNKLNQENSILDALTMDYTSVYYCDLEADSLIPLKQCAYTNAFAAECNIDKGMSSYSFRIQYYFDHFVIQDSAPDFLEKLSLENVKRYLLRHKRLAYRFQSLPNRAGQQYFEVQIVRLEGVNGFKAVMGYRYIDDIIAEHEKQKQQLEEALSIATLNSEIVGAISKIYWLIYRMDLVLGTYEEISAGSEVHQLTGKHGRTAEVFKEVRETVVVPEHQQMMKTFLDTSTLPERLRETDSVAVEYQAVGGSWHLGRFIAKKRDLNGQVTNVLYVVRQIDKQKQIEIEYRKKLLETAEEARRASIAKTDFLRRMSHDIRTPINGIQGMINIAEHFPDDLAKQKECRDKVKEAAGFLLDLVNSVLDMNKLESGAVVLEHQPFDLRRLLQESAGIVRMSADPEGLKVHFDSSKISHSHLLGSAIHVKQILLNITGNAVKYNRKGGSVFLSCREIACSGNTATYQFQCRDTGCGMSREFLSHAFEPFAQEDKGARTAYMGTGLGLSIVKQLVEMMGGTIEVESELNVGSLFTLTIPFELDVSDRKEEDPDETAPDDCLTGLRVLLAEDNELNMEIAEFLLEQAGMNVTEARNGMEAVELFAASDEHGFDFILMDVMMPVMDGLTATRKIRAMERADAKTIPIFAMTANAFAEDKEQSRKAGMNEHISKPLNEDDVLRALKKYLSGKRKEA